MTNFPILGFIVLFVIPSLIGDMMETITNPALALAKKQQRLIDLEEKYKWMDVQAGLKEATPPAEVVATEDSEEASK